MRFFTSLQQLTFVAFLAVSLGLGMGVNAIADLQVGADSAQNQAAIQATSSAAGDKSGAVGRATGAQPAQFDVEAKANPKTDKVVAQTEFGPTTTLGDYMEKILRYALPLGIFFSFMTSMYAGILFMISQGEPDKIKEGREMIQGVLLGLIVLILARLLATYLYIPSSSPVDGKFKNPLVSTEQQP